MSIQVSIFLRKFGYDPMNRLLSAAGREASTNSDLDLWANPSRTGTGGNPSPSSMQAYTRTYAYDKMGNILQLKQTAGNTFTRNFQYNNLSNNNLLHSIKKADNTTDYATFTHDANGNKLTAGTERKYLWGHADQLKAYVNQAGTGEPSIYAQYLYSGGQRVKKQVRTSGGGTETTVYIDGVFEHKYNGTNSQSIIKVGGVATVRTGYAFDGLSGTSYELTNHLGSVSIRLDNNGTIIDQEEYYPFGDSSVRTWSGKRYRYVGKEKDAESGLYYYGARYYSAWTCRFISVDPLAGDYPQLTSYNYASNAPINSLDIDGMQNPKEDTGGDQNSTLNPSGYLKVDDTGLINPELHATEAPEGIRYTFDLGNVHLENIEMVNINGENYFDVGQHLYYGKGGWSTTGTRFDQITEETRAGIRVDKILNLPNTKDIEGYQKPDTYNYPQQSWDVANMYINPKGMCFAIQMARYNFIFEKNVLELNHKSSDYEISGSLDRENYVGYGVAGALIKNGYGTKLSTEDIWAGKAQKGASIQWWWGSESNIMEMLKNNEPVSGHSITFYSYVYSSGGEIIGFNFIDQFGFNGFLTPNAPILRNVYGDDFMIGANLLDK